MRDALSLAVINFSKYAKTGTEIAKVKLVLNQNLYNLHISLIVIVPLDNQKNN